MRKNRYDKMIKMTTHRSIIIYFFVFTIIGFLFYLLRVEKFDSKEILTGAIGAICCGIFISAILYLMGIIFKKFVAPPEADNKKKDQYEIIMRTLFTFFLFFVFLAPMIFNFEFWIAMVICFVIFFIVHFLLIKILGPDCVPEAHLWSKKKNN